MRVGDPVALNENSAQPVMLTRMGFGTAPLGNLYRRIGEEDAQAALQGAFDAGIRYFDTAPQYGLGIAEARLALAIERFSRSSICLSTKVGRVLIDCQPNEVTPESFVDVPDRKIVYDYTYDGVMRSFEDSCRRLKVEAVDILLIHDIDPGTHGVEASERKLGELMDGGGYRALSELKAAGRTAAIGAGLNEWQTCERLLRMADFDAFLLAGRYTLLEQEALDSFLPLCVARDVGIILGGPYNSGVLATGAITGARYNYAPAPQAVLGRVARLEEVCIGHATPLIAAALQFVMAHPAVKSVIPGAANAREVAANAAVFEREIPAGLWSDLRAEGLIRPDAPIPTQVPHAA